MTKVSVFGQKATESKQLKPIEFVKRVYSDGTVVPPTILPKDWSNVMLYKATSDKEKCFDLILAFDDNDGARAVFLGHWNDGVI